MRRRLQCRQVCDVRVSGPYDVVDAADECSRIELAAHHVIGTVADDGDAPVADEGDLLLGFDLLEHGTELIGSFEIGFALDVDEDEIEAGLLQDLGGLVVVVAAGYFVSGDPENLVPDGAEKTLRRDVENR